MFGSYDSMMLTLVMRESLTEPISVSVILQLLGVKTQKEAAQKLGLSADDFAAALQMWGEMSLEDEMVARDGFMNAINIFSKNS